MVEDDDGSSQPKGIENRAELLRKADEPKVEAIRRCVEAMEREALHSHAMPDELGSRHRTGLDFAHITGSRA